MRKQLILGLLLIAASLFTTAASAYHVAGTIYCDTNQDGVIDENDTPLSGISVVAHSETYGSFYGTTDIDGSFYIDTALEGGFGDIYTVTIESGSLNTTATIITPVSASYEIDLAALLEFDNADFLIDDPACRETASFCGDGILDEGEQCDDGNIFDGDGCSASCTFEISGEGCTPGYWKQTHHFDSWPDSITPDTQFSDYFEDAFPGQTMLEVLEAKGGGLNALGRHVVAALLNATSQNVGYDFPDVGVIGLFNSSYPGSKPGYNAAKNILVDMNELGCPLN